MRVLWQIIRGCGTLPHVGEHPGTAFLFGFILMGGLAGAKKGGLWGFIGGSIFMAVPMGLLYAYGAYDRANRSDELEELENPREKIEPTF